MNREINDTSETNNLLETPYKGLEPYSEADALIFFGRESKWKNITDNLTATRLTLLYGASGVGKTSLLRAGVAYHLLQDAKKNLAEYDTPEFAVVVFNAWQGDPLEGLVKQVEKDVKSLLNGKVFDPLPSSLELDQILEIWAERLNENESGGDLFIILDQFEEYFLYHPNEEGTGRFAEQFPRAVNSPGLPVNFLISIREDSLSKLDYFKERINEEDLLLKNRLELKPLDKVSAREAIIKPIEKYNRQRSSAEKVNYEPELVDEVLDNIASPEGYIQTPYLQLVMKRMWKKEVLMNRLKKRNREDYSYCLQLKTLNELGGVLGVINDHVNNKIDNLSLVEKEAVALIFYYLVTPSGEKIAYSVSDLASYTELNTDNLAQLLESLAQGENRILRTVKPSLKTNEQRYEIFYDALAKPILKWLKRYLQEVEQAKQYHLFVQTRLRPRDRKNIQQDWKDVKKNRKKECEYWYEEAKKLENNKHYEEAINYCDQALKICPQDYDCLYHRGRSLEELGHYHKHQRNLSKAQEFYQKAIDNFKQARAVRQKEEEDFFWACWSQGYIEYELYQYQDAIASFEQALALHPDDEQAQSYLNKSLEKAGSGV